MLFLVVFKILHPKTPNEMREFQVGKSLIHCAECEEPIPEARLAALSGVKLCIDCMQECDAAYKPRPGSNRRGSKDSQLR
ncbi:MAG TPA: DksA/TraR family C4-type zinc finger protein [Hellea balneolensis]|uniref:DksA/TraR family C4-type zinc finger protein n=1 Tax=Hellea balneolensis TaxID=287478 RepID=A0A7C5R3R0_9PROT|nr:DksA/TraR family C4-type zinc finger protein [Hellea balneolensis]